MKISNLQSICWIDLNEMNEGEGLYYIYFSEVGRYRFKLFVILFVKEEYQYLCSQLPRHLISVVHGCSQLPYHLISEAME